jgi:hypothetical protein
MDDQPMLLVEDVAARMSLARPPRKGIAQPSLTGILGS